MEYFSNKIFFPVKHQNIFFTFFNLSYPLCCFGIFPYDDAKSEIIHNSIESICIQEELLLQPVGFIGNILFLSINPQMTDTLTLRKTVSAKIDYVNRFITVIFTTLVKYWTKQITVVKTDVDYFSQYFVLITT